MSAPEPKDLERARLSQIGRNVLEFTASHRARRRSQIENRVFAAIKTQTLTPEQALAAWYEMHSLHALERDLHDLAEGRSRG